MQPKVGGKLHLRLNTDTSPIADRYREGKLKRALKREFKSTWLLSFFLCPKGVSEFAKLQMGLVVLVKKMSVLINFLLQNTNLVSVLSKICPNVAGHV